MPPLDQKVILISSTKIADAFRLLNFIAQTPLVRTARLANCSSTPFAMALREFTNDSSGKCNVTKLTRFLIFLPFTLNFCQVKLFRKCVFFRFPVCWVNRRHHNWLSWLSRGYWLPWNWLLLNLPNLLLGLAHTLRSLHWHFSHPRLRILLLHLANLNRSSLLTWYLESWRGVCKRVISWRS